MTIEYSIDSTCIPTIDIVAIAIATIHHADRGRSSCLTPETEATGSTRMPLEWFKVHIHLQGCPVGSGPQQFAVENAGKTH